MNLIERLQLRARISTPEALFTQYARFFNDDTFTHPVIGGEHSVASIGPRYDLSLNRDITSAHRQRLKAQIQRFFAVRMWQSNCSTKLTFWLDHKPINRRPYRTTVLGHPIDATADEVRRLWLVNAYLRGVTFPDLEAPCPPTKNAAGGSEPASRRPRPLRANLRRL